MGLDVDAEAGGEVRRGSDETAWLKESWPDECVRDFKGPPEFNWTALEAEGILVEKVPEEEKLSFRGSVREIPREQS